MNSYQTANAAFHAAGHKASAGVAHGRAFFDPRTAGQRLASRLGELVAHRMDSQMRSLSGWDVARNVGKWNDEDKERQLRLKGAGGVTAAAAGGTSWPRFSVRLGEYATRKWDVIDRKGRVQATFGQWHWANIAAKAWNESMSVTSFGRAKMLDVSEFTTQ